MSNSIILQSLQILKSMLNLHFIQLFQSNTITVIFLQSLTI